MVDGLDQEPRRPIELDRARGDWRLAVDMVGER
jgi:hypothetical protein